MKTCLQCKEIKPFSEFYKRYETGRYRTVCKTCWKETCKRWQKTEKGKANSRKQVKKYRSTEKGKIQARLYQQREEVKIRRQKEAFLYRQTEKGKIVHRRNSRKYRKKHFLKIKAQNFVNRAVVVGKLPHVNTLQCHYCGKAATQYHHHSGYKPICWLSVFPVCNRCHNNLHKRIAI